MQRTLDAIGSAGTYKNERALSSSQARRVTTHGREVLNFCANNYLGLANDPDVIAAAKVGLDRWGFGLASVRFICGTQDQHLELEQRVSAFLGTEDTILFSSCFDANGGVFEVLFDSSDAIISDELNHASLIDGIRLSKATRYRYRNRDMGDLEAQLRAASGARRRVIVTDGVFSMDGYFAPLDAICALAHQYDALVLVDDSHAVGLVGPDGRGTPSLFGVDQEVDIYTGTFGKALGGASGGYVSSSAAIVRLLRQRARPYLFSNTLPPAVVAGTLASFDAVESRPELRQALAANTRQFRSSMTAAGFDLLEGDHAIVPVMVGDDTLASSIAELMLDEGIYVVAFSHPVVPHGTARIRVQLSAAHSAHDVDAAVAAFISVRATLRGKNSDRSE